MTSRRPSLVSLSFIAVSLATLGACGYTAGSSTVKIHYSQVGACNGYQSGSGITTKRSNQAFVVFKIESFDGTNSGIDFYFFASRLYVDLNPDRETWGSSLGAGKYFASKDRRYTDPIGVPGVEDVKAPPKVVTQVDRFAFIAVPTKAEVGAPEANKTSYRLFYDTVTGKEAGGPAYPQIEFVKTNEAQTTWPDIDDCLHLDVGEKK